MLGRHKDLEKVINIINNIVYDIKKNIDSFNISINVLDMDHGYIFKNSNPFIIDKYNILITTEKLNSSSVFLTKIFENNSLKDQMIHQLF